MQRLLPYTRTIIALATNKRNTFGNIIVALKYNNIDTAAIPVVNKFIQ